MIVTRIRPFPGLAEPDWGGFDRVRDGLLRMAEEMGRPAMFTPGSRLFPLVNVTQTDGHFYVRAELPGVKPSDLDVSTLGNKLTISGKRELPHENERVSYHRREREGGTFSRSIQLPGEIDRDKVDAHYEHGVLTVTLPRSEASKPRQITVKRS